MTTTYNKAVDSIQKLFKEAWKAGGSLGEVVYENVPSPKLGEIYARFFIRHFTGGQSTLSGELGRRQFTRSGVITVQVFVPFGKDGLSEGYRIGRLVAEAYEGESTDDGVWFRNVRINEVGPSDKWFQINVLADFQYDEVR